MSSTGKSKNLKKKKRQEMEQTDIFLRLSNNSKIKSAKKISTIHHSLGKLLTLYIWLKGIS